VAACPLTLPHSSPSYILPHSLPLPPSRLGQTRRAVVDACAPYLTAATTLQAAKSMPEAAEGHTLGPMALGAEASEWHLKGDGDREDQPAPSVAADARGPDPPA
jgi:hypothetical protein